MRTRLTDQDILSIKFLYESGLSSTVLSKRFNTVHSNILNHLRKLNVKMRNRKDAAREGFRAGRIIIKKNKIPEILELDNNLSYILGVLCGDGYMDYNILRGNYHIGLSAIDKEFVVKFQLSLYEFFKLNSSNEYRESRKINWSPQFITRLCSKEACEFINSIGSFKKHNWNVPDIIKNSSQEIKCSFLKGFLDSEGEIDKAIGRITATSMNLNGLENIGNLFNDLGIRSTLIKTKDIRPNTHQKYRLRINDKNSICNFNRLIGFCINRKQAILDLFVNKWQGRSSEAIIPDKDRLTP